MPIPFSTTFGTQPVFSNLALEALCTGIGVITDRADFLETYRDIVGIRRNQILIVSPRDYLQSARAIAEWVQKMSRASTETCLRISYQDYLSACEKTYGVLLGSEN